MVMGLQHDTFSGSAPSLGLVALMITRRPGQHSGAPLSCFAARSSTASRRLVLGLDREYILGHDSDAFNMDYRLVVA
jgi:hypothetical protein